MSDGLPVGSRIRVKPGVAAPDLADFSIEGWTGTIVELSEKKAKRKYIIEWDASTVEKLPAAYIQQCEEKQLYYVMTCLTADDVELDD